MKFRKPVFIRVGEQVVVKSVLNRRLEGIGVG